MPFHMLVSACLVDLTIDLNWNRQTDMNKNWDVTRAFIKEENIIIGFAPIRKLRAQKIKERAKTLEENKTECVRIILQ